MGGLVRPDPFRVGSVHFRAENAGFMVINDKQPVRSIRHRGDRCGDCRPLEKVSQRHELLSGADILAAGRVEDEDPPVARHFEVAVGFLLDLSDMAEKGEDVVPLQVLRGRCRFCPKYELWRYSRYGYG